MWKNVEKLKDSLHYTRFSADSFSYENAKIMENKADLFSTISLKIKDFQHFNSS